MTPLAKLYIRREKVITRNCDDEILQAQIIETSENGDDEANNIRELSIAFDILPGCEKNNFFN